MDFNEETATGVAETTVAVGNYCRIADDRRQVNEPYIYGR